MVIEHFFDSRDELFNALNNDCRETLQHAVSSNQKASFLVSGGSTPAPLYQQLSNEDLPWSDINVALVDERWVAPDNASSNQRFIATTLLQNKAANAPFIPMKNGFDSAKSGLASTIDAYRALGDHYDLTILGMGNDGHTASLFPYSDGLEDALAPNASAALAAIMADKSEVTGNNLERMTLSMSGLLKSRHLVLLITGEAKMAVYRKALDCQDIQRMPVGAILQQQKVPVHVYWAA